MANPENPGQARWHATRSERNTLHNGGHVMTERSFVMSARQASELDHALERNDWTSADVKAATKGNLLGQFRKVLLGQATIVEKQVQTPKLLNKKGYYSAIKLVEHHDPSAFYQMRDGLRVYGDFQTRIVAAAKPTEAGAKWKKLPRFELAANATGQSLKDARPQAVWEASDFCAWLSVKLAAQKGGKAGELINNGWANLFLVEGVNGEVFVVFVYWLDGEWLVDAWRLGDGWGGGGRFGFRN